MVVAANTRSPLCPLRARLGLFTLARVYPISRRFLNTIVSNILHLLICYNAFRVMLMDRDSSRSAVKEYRKTWWIFSFLSGSRVSLRGSAFSPSTRWNGELSFLQHESRSTSLEVSIHTYPKYWNTRPFPIQSNIVKKRNEPTLSHVWAYLLNKEKHLENPLVCDATFSSITVYQTLNLRLP